MGVSACGNAQAIRNGADEDAQEVELPPVRREDMERIVKAGIHGGYRETLCTFVRCRQPPYCLLSCA